MKQLTALLLVTMFGFALFSQPAWGQDYYTWQDGERITLEVKTDYYVARVADSLYALTTTVFDARQIPQEHRYTQYDKQIIWLKDISQSYTQSLMDDAGVPVYVSPVYSLDDGGMKYTNGELLVRWNLDINNSQIQDLEHRYQLRRIEGSRSEYLGETILYEYLPPYETTSLEVANALQESGSVLWTNPNYSYVVKRFSEPNDPLYSQQWNIPQIEGDLMRDISKGSDAVIAVFDDGVDLNHIDLADNLFRDGSGNVIGYNATDRGPSNDPHPDGNDAHGTAVAGIMAAVTNNDEGIAGLAPAGNIMPLQMGYTDPVWGSPFIFTQPDWWVQSINFATNNGANSVNMSVGLGTDTDFNNAMNNAMSNGVVLVAASGNSGASSIAYPANFSGVIATGASLQNDTRWSNSQYGSGLDLVAPGGAPIIWTTDRPGSIGYTSNSYFEFSGTSAAAPHTAAIAGVMKSMNPNLTPSQIRTILQNTADWKSHMNSNEYGHGRLNAYSAVKHALPLQLENHAFTSSQTLNEGAHIFGNATVTSGATLTIGADNVAVIDGTLSSSGSTTAHLVVEGKLIVDSDAELNGIRVTVADGGKLTARPNVTFDMNRSGLVVSGTADFGEGFQMLRGSVRVHAGGQANFDHPLIEIYDPSPWLVKGHGFWVSGRLNLFGGILEGEGSSYTWPGL